MLPIDFPKQLLVFPKHWKTAIKKEKLLTCLFFNSFYFDGYRGARNGDVDVINFPCCYGMGGKGYHVNQVNATCENHPFKPWAWQDTTRIWRLTCRRNMTWPLMWLSIWYETMALEASWLWILSNFQENDTPQNVCLMCALGWGNPWNGRPGHGSKVGISQSCLSFHRWKAQHAVMCLWDANRWDD